MVGRLYRIESITHDGQLTGKWLFWHEHSQTEIGLLNMGDSHGGIDAAVVNFLAHLKEPGCIAWHCTADPVRNQYVTPFDDFVELATFRAIGGRSRLFVPDFSKELQFWYAPKVWLSKYDLPPVNRDPRTGTDPTSGYAAAKTRRASQRLENQPRLL